MQSQFGVFEYIESIFEKQFQALYLLIINQMYNLSNKIKQDQSHSITPQQATQVQHIDEYLVKNKVHDLLNEALAKLIQTRPEKVKEGLVGIFKAMKDKQTYFKKSDFESMFQSYDFFSSKGGNQILYPSLIQALQKINIKYTKQEFLNVHPQFKLDRAVKKIDFINIMEAEYKKKVKL